MTTERRRSGGPDQQLGFDSMALAGKIGQELPTTFHADGRVVVARSFPSDLMYSQVDIRPSSWRVRVSRWGIVDPQPPLLTLLSDGSATGFPSGEVHRLRRVTRLRTDGHRVYRTVDGRETLDFMELGGWVSSTDQARPEAVQGIISQLEAAGVPQFATIGAYEVALEKSITNELFG